MTLQNMPSWKERMICTNRGGHPSFLSIAQSAARFTVSNALVRSMKSRWRSWCCSTHFSWSCLIAKTISTVPLCFLKPHWLSDTTSSNMCLVIRVSMIRASILPAMLRRLIPRWLSQDERSPLFLYVDDVGIPEVPWELAIDPEHLEHPGKMSDKGFTTSFEHLGWYSIRSRSLACLQLFDGCINLCCVRWGIKFWDHGALLNGLQCFIGHF